MHGAQMTAPLMNPNLIFVYGARYRLVSYFMNKKSFGVNRIREQSIPHQFKHLEDKYNEQKTTHTTVWQAGNDRNPPTERPINH